MKTKLTLLFFLTFSLVFSQKEKSKEDLFRMQLDNITNNYYGYEKNDSSIVVQSKLLDDRLTKAFNQVVFGSSDLVDNASAFGLSVNEEKTNASVSTNFHLSGAGKNQWFIKAGINANGSGSIFDLYSGNEWQNSVGGSVGLIFKFAGSGFTTEKANELEKNKVLRKIFIRDSIMETLINLKLDDYIKTRKSYRQALKDADTANIKKYYKALNYIEAILKDIEASESKKRARKLNFDNYSIDSLNQNNEKVIREMLDSLWSGGKFGKKALKKVIENVAYQYDMKNVKNTGYSFWWFDANLALNNNTYNFSEEAGNIDSSVLADFNNLDEEKTGINKLNTTVSFNVNYSQNSSLYGAWYGQLGFRYKSGSFLNSNLIDGTPKISSFENNLFMIEDENKQVIGDFSSIDRSLQYGSFDFYVARFFGKKKVFGLNLALSHRFGIKIPQNSFYEDNLSILFGPVFRKPKDDDDTGLTFSVDIGFDNAIYGDDLGDSFVARIRVGIPFKLYNINK